jgi:hypothetical protein
MGELKLFHRAVIVTLVTPSLGQIIPQCGSLRFHRGGDEQIIAPADAVALADAAQPAAQPGVGQGGIHRQSLIELRNGLGRLVLGGKEESL